jgi:type II secretory pathway component PulK
MNRSSIKCSGFVATITALTMLALVTVAATELTAAFSADIRRTRDQQVDAQLRQVLIAGIIQSRQNNTIQLPQELQNENVKLTVQTKTITAEMGRNHLSIELPQK